MSDKIVLGLAVILGYVVLGFLLSYPAMILWNLCLVPAVTGLKEVEWLQMWGIIVLASSFFKK